MYEPPAKWNQGAKRLKELLDSSGQLQCELAEELGVPRDQLCRWMWGWVKPSTANRLKLLRFGIAIDRWDSPTTEPRPQPRRRRRAA